MEAKTSEPTKPEGQIYYECEMESLERLFNDCKKNPDLDPFEWVLSISKLTESETFTLYNEETGEEEEVETGREIITGHKFLISWGGPESWIYSTNNGRSLNYFYCHWGGSDEWRTGLTGKQEDEFNALFGFYFECLEESEKVGAVIE